MPIQIIYGGKTSASQPCGFKFPSGFCVSQNPKHWSNEKETLKLIENIIHPFIVKKRSELSLPDTQKALIIWDVFKGQMTDAVMQKLSSLNCEFVPVPPNMTHFFQPLDLTVNGAAKMFMRNRFITYYSDTVKQQLDLGKSLDDVEVDFRLTTMQWLVDLYNFCTTTKGKQIIVKGWKKAGVTGLLDGSTEIPCADPFTLIYSST